MPQSSGVHDVRNANPTKDMAIMAARIVFFFIIK